MISPVGSNHAAGGRTSNRRSACGGEAHARHAATILPRRIEIEPFRKLGKLNTATGAHFLLLAGYTS